MRFYIALFAFYTAAGFVDAASHNKRNSSRRVEQQQQQLLQKSQLKKSKNKKSGDNCTRCFYVETAEFESKDQLIKAGKPAFD
jgi:hypothetical protein